MAAPSWRCTPRAGSACSTARPATIAAAAAEASSSAARRTAESREAAKAEWTHARVLRLRGHERRGLVEEAVGRGGVQRAEAVGVAKRHGVGGLPGVVGVEHGGLLEAVTGAVVGVVEVGVHQVRSWE